jgi:hypothetical protein
MMVRLLKGLKKVVSTVAPFELVNRIAALRIALFSCAIFLTIFYTPFGHLLEEKISSHLNFIVRNRLGLDPILHPNIKIFSMDDRTYEKVGSGDLSLEDWSLLIHSIAQMGPRRILIRRVNHQLRWWTHQV